ncbi:hypothetical protein PQQ77_02810 [Paraburkholderia strydomiana]|uniref:hypothetical protein n=1 Tax=Paraburkholderia strydomiana TaxID=1245417 RepID=UPI0038B9DFE7
MLRRTAGFGIIPKMLAARRTYPAQADSQWRPPCAAFAHRRTRGEARLQSRQISRRRSDSDRTQIRRVRFQTSNPLDDRRPITVAWTAVSVPAALLLAALLAALVSVFVAPYRPRHGPSAAGAVK